MEKYKFSSNLKHKTCFYKILLFKVLFEELKSKNLFLYNSLWASLKTHIICLASPLIPLHWRGKGAFLEMPLCKKCLDLLSEQYYKPELIICPGTFFDFETKI